MNKGKITWFFSAIALGAILYGSIFLYGGRSDAFKFAESAVARSPAIQSRVGQVQRVSLLTGEYRERFFNTKKWATMTLDITGDKGEVTANVAVAKVNGSWTLNEILVDGKTIYRQDGTDAYP